MTRHYREDIDWLRAIAVISVLGFHWDIRPFHGAGFVGVDIFFVISGFLITQIIQSEMASGDFSFARFYERRVRRLLPALYVMVLLTAIPSFYYLLPSERYEFFRSIAAVVTFTSNFFFWMQTGYFDRAADEKPLLHTWSLSVEEQFYLALPLVIWVLLKWMGPDKRRQLALPAGLGIVAIASFAFAHWLMTSGHKESAFFLSPPRAWEFLAGSLVAMPGVPAIRNIHLYRTARIAGLGMIAGAVFGYRSYVTFPGVTALLPCAGAALFIWAGLGSSVTQRARYSPLSIAGFFGRISYSLYLWHWPLFIYAKFSKPGLTLLPHETAALFVFATAISYVSYRFVEQPLRTRALISSRRIAFGVAGCSSLVLLAASLIAAGAGNVPGKDPRMAQLEAYDHYAYQLVYRFGSCFVGSWAAYDDKACLTPAPDKINVLLWGDSLAAHYDYGLRAALDPNRVNLMQATAESCIPALPPLARPLCHAQSERVAALLKANKPDLVILSADWMGYARGMGVNAMLGILRGTIAELRGAGVKVAVIGLSIQFRSRLPSMLLRAEGRHLDPLPLGELLVPFIFDADSHFKASLANEAGVSFVSVLDNVCPAQKCPAMLPDGVPLAWDHAHLTAEGSVYVAGKIAPQLDLPLKAN